MGFPSFVLEEFLGIATYGTQLSRKLERGKIDQPEIAEGGEV